MKKEEVAISSFNSGYNCTQAVLTTFSEQYGLDQATALRISCCFGGGMGMMAGVCGAVSGAYMVLGLRYCSSGNDIQSSKEDAYSMIRQFTDRFKERHGSIICKEILGCDISTEDGMHKAMDEGLFESVCSDFVRDSAKIIEALI